MRNKINVLAAVLLLAACGQQDPVPAPNYLAVAEAVNPRVTTLGIPEIPEGYWTQDATCFRDSRVLRECDPDLHQSCQVWTPEADRDPYNPDGREYTCCRHYDMPTSYYRWTLELDDRHWEVETRCDGWVNYTLQEVHYSLDGTYLQEIIDASGYVGAEWIHFRAYNDRLSAVHYLIETQDTISGYDEPHSTALTTEAIREVPMEDGDFTLLQTTAVTDRFLIIVDDRWDGSYHRIRFSAAALWDGEVGDGGQEY